MSFAIGRIRSWASSPHFHPLERCLPANMKPTARPPPPPFSYPDSTRRKAFTCLARWRSRCSLVCSDRPRHNQRANPGFTKVITVLARRKSKSTGNDVLFVGVSDAGKTAILSSVSHQRPVGGNQTKIYSESCATAGIPSATTHTCLITNELELNNATKREKPRSSRGHPRTPTNQGPIPGSFQ